MSDFLATMAAGSRARAAAAAADTVARAASAPAAPPLVHDGFALIAEIKWVAPSAGRLATPPDDRAGALVARAAAYADAGASAISVLTEPSRFGGALDDLAAVAASSAVPAMRKDFLVDPVQLHEARAVGAGGALLIARMLPSGRLDAMLRVAVDLGLWTLVEAFDVADLEATEAALAAVPEARASTWVGVNTRDLATLQVDPDRLATLAPHLPADTVCVAESGLATADDVSAAVDLGYRAALVGSALMRADDPAALVAAMVAAGRGA